MRDGLAPFVGQRHRFAATIDRIGVKDEWRSAITVLLKDVELADTGDVVADHLWLRYGPWANELASGLQVGARITFDAVVTRYVKGYTGDDSVRQAARPRELDYGLEKIQSVRGHGHGRPG